MVMCCQISFPQVVFISFFKSVFMSITILFCIYVVLAEDNVDLKDESVSFPLPFFLKALCRVVIIYPLFRTIWA